MTLAGNWVAGVNRGVISNLPSLMNRLHHFLKLLTSALVCLATAVCHAQTEAQSEHPLTPILVQAADALARIQSEYPGYSCTFIKRERVNGKLLPPSRLRLKVRHEQWTNDEITTPFSVYALFERGPKKGREVIFVKGRNDDRILVRNGGRRMAALTVSVNPNGALAMASSRYPITTIGIENLIKRLVNVGKDELQFDECEVRTVADKTLYGRKCSLIEVKHPVQRPHFRYHLARIYTDNEFDLPIGFEAYQWPEEEGGPPLLIEQYSYLNLKFETPTNEDFDPENEAYSFYRSRSKRSHPRTAPDAEAALITSKKGPTTLAPTSVTEGDSGTSAHE